jgi:hypothetical protein
VETAADVLEGPKHALSDHPDLIISDISMPNLVGIQMLKALRRMPACKQILVMAVSAYGSGRPVPGPSAWHDGPGTINKAVVKNSCYFLPLLTRIPPRPPERPRKFQSETRGPDYENVCRSLPYARRSGDAAHL